MTEADQKNAWISVCDAAGGAVEFYALMESRLAKSLEDKNVPVQKELKDLVEICK